MTQGYYVPPCEYGERVWWRSDGLSGEGTYVLCWLGIEECWDVRIDNSDTAHVHPALGDEMIPLSVVFA